MRLSAIKTVGEILGGYKTKTVTKTSKRTGRDYQVEAVPSMEVYAVSKATPVVREDGSRRYKYSVSDPNADLQYDITAPNRVDVKFGTIIRCTNVTCGVIPDTSRVWVTADSVAIKQ